MQIPSSPIGALAPVLSLAEARQARQARSTAHDEHLNAAGSNRAHVHVLPFPKTAHVRHSTRSSKAQRVADSAAAVKASRDQWTDDEWYRAMGARIRAARIERGVSEEDAARVAGRSVETWRNYERTGRGHITFPVLLFARRYGVSLDALIRDPE